MKNKIIVNDNLAVIYTNKGEPIYIDIGDIDKVIGYTWYLSKGYARTTINKKHVMLHRLLMQPPKGLMVDHINHIKTDNRRCNLRVCTNAENQRNQGRNKSNTSGVKGISWDKRARRWHSYIGFNNEIISIGYFSDFEIAVHFRHLFERILYREFAYIEPIL